MTSGAVAKMLWEGHMQLCCISQTGEVEPRQRLSSLLETLASDAMVRSGACKMRKDKIGDDEPGKTQ